MKCRSWPVRSRQLISWDIQHCRHSWSCSAPHILPLSLYLRKLHRRPRTWTIPGPCQQSPLMYLLTRIKGHENWCALLKFPLLCIRRNLYLCSAEHFPHRIWNNQRTLTYQDPPFSWTPVRRYVSCKYSAKHSYECFEWLFGDLVAECCINGYMR